MKLKDWADKQGISYLTAWRWFKAGDARLVSAYQSDSGTIIVPDDDTSEQSMGTTQSNDIMSIVLKKTVELSKSNASIEDFAAWILSNFNLRINTVSEGPKYSRNKPKSEEIQNHFKQFLKPKGEKPKPNMFVTTDPEAFYDLMDKSDNLTAQELVEEIHKIGAEGGVSVNPSDAPEVLELMKDISSAVNTPKNLLKQDLTIAEVNTINSFAGGVFTRGVDLTPQQLNYTSPDNSAPSNVFYNASYTGDISNNSSVGIIGSNCVTSTFQPTQKEMQSAVRVSAIVDKPRRGRKSSKITGNK